MEKTGESYVAARRHVVGSQSSVPLPAHLALSLEHAQSGSVPVRHVALCRLSEFASAHGRRAPPQVLAALVEALDAATSAHTRIAMLEAWDDVDDVPQAIIDKALALTSVPGAVRSRICALALGASRFSTDAAWAQAAMLGLQSTSETERAWVRSLIHSSKWRTPSLVPYFAPYLKLDHLDLAETAQTLRECGTEGEKSVQNWALNEALPYLRALDANGQGDILDSGELPSERVPRILEALGDHFIPLLEHFLCSKPAPLDMLRDLNGMGSSAMLLELVRLFEQGPQALRLPALRLLSSWVKTAQPHAPTTAVTQAVLKLATAGMKDDNPLIQAAAVDMLSEEWGQADLHPEESIAK